MDAGDRKSLPKPTVETLERIYIGRRFKNDTERLEKLFELYTQMTAKQLATTKTAVRRPKATHK